MMLKAMWPAAAALWLAGALAAGEAPAGQWTRFRGPDGAGISPATGLPVKWTEKDYLWKTKLPGSGHSSPVVWGQKVFITCADRDASQLIVVCLKAPDGAIAWEKRFELAQTNLNQLNSLASATPAVDAERVYLHWATREEVALAALDHAGGQVWRRNFGQFVSEHGGGVSPILHGGLVILGNDQEGNSSIIALDSATGQDRWVAPRTTGKAAYGTPCIWRPPDGPPELIFTSNAHGVTSLDPATGKVNWELGGIFSLRTVHSPAVADGLIVGSCGVGGVARRFVAVQPGSKKPEAKPRLVWDQTKAIPYVPTPLAKDGKLFLWTDNGVVRCLRAATGEQLWEGKTQDLFYGSPVWAEGRLYCISRKGVVHVVAAGDEFQHLAANPLGEGSHATPAIAGGVLYLRTFSHVIAIKAGK